ncbi:MAG: hypothetical protein OEX81_03640 [Candidatus Pacebacteria bacterium]|nr:hypothetical protein [Candidatus Paceibacterota bacterium]
MINAKAGMYNWSGPGTVRMINLKYPGDTINSKSVLGAYEYENLRHAKEKLNVTDAWVTYSWGFNPKTEQPDYKFLRSKLENFHKLGIRVHAYVQGPNLVLDDHQDRDYYCRTYNGGLIPYHRGRKMACVNNPYFNKYIRFKIGLALKEEVDGVFVDNCYFGQMPLMVGNKNVSFFGCNCKYCQKKFKNTSGFNIPKYFKIDSDVYRAYKKFRIESLMGFVKDLSKQIKDAGKYFGVNTFDPKFDSNFYYGVDLQQMNDLVDYFLFENHALPRKNNNNVHLESLIKELKKPVFIVSYKQGIGQEDIFRQNDFNAIHTEGLKIGYKPCYKSSEFTTKGEWFNLDFASLDVVKELSDLLIETIDHPPIKQLKFPLLTPFYNKIYPPLLEKYFENMTMRKIGNKFFYSALR